MAKDPDAALRLVSARPDAQNDIQNRKSDGDDSSDPDLKRAKDLIELHSSVKVAHQDGTDQQLSDAREAVEKVLRTLK